MAHHRPDAEQTSQDAFVRTHHRLAVILGAVLAVSSTAGPAFARGGGGTATVTLTGVATSDVVVPIADDYVNSPAVATMSIGALGATATPRPYASWGTDWWAFLTAACGTTRPTTSDGPGDIDPNFTQRHERRLATRRFCLRWP